MHILVVTNVFSKRYNAKVFWLLQHKLDTHPFVKAGPLIQVFNRVQFRNEFEIRFVEERLHVSPRLSSRITWDWRGKLKSLSRHSIFSIFQDKQWIRLKKCREWCKLTFICSLLKGVKRLHTKALRARVYKQQQINKREQTSEKYRIEPTK
jgi:hypothetical protein